MTSSGNGARAARARDELPRTGAPGGIRGLRRDTDSAAPPPQPSAQVHQRSGETQLQGPSPLRPGAAPPRPALLSPGPLWHPYSPSKRYPNTPGGSPPFLLPKLRVQPPWGRRHPFAPLSPPRTREGQSRETNRNSQTSLRSGLGCSLQRRRQLRRQHLGVVPARPPPAQPDTRRGLRGGRRERAFGACSPSSRLGPSGRAPPARPPSALPVGHRRQALGSERELFVSPPRLRHRRGWGREAGLRSPRHRPSPAAPPPPALPPALVWDVGLSVRNRKPPPV
nr:serine/arginine repetitive matrix protein 1-like [Equus asinus]